MTSLLPASTLVNDSTQRYIANICVCVNIVFSLEIFFVQIIPVFTALVSDYFIGNNVACNSGIVKINIRDKYASI